jgi:hypothetical protein
MTPTKILYLTKLKTMPFLVIDTAEALFASGLEGYDQEEAFAALDEAEKKRFVDDPRRWMASSIDTIFS